MNEITAAIIGAIASAFLMALANISNRRERDIRELFHRINSLEKEVAKQQNPRSRLRGLWSFLGKELLQWPVSTDAGLRGLPIAGTN